MLESNDDGLPSMVFHKVLKGEVSVLPGGNGSVETKMLSTSEIILDPNRRGFVIEAFSLSLRKESHGEAATFTIGNLCTPQILNILETADVMPESQVSPAAIQISILSMSADVSRTELEQKFKIVEHEWLTNLSDWEREYWAEEGYYLITEQDIEQARNILKLAGIDLENRQLFASSDTLP